MASSKSSKARRTSGTSSKPLFGRSSSGITDNSLFGLLSVINLDDICHKTFPINALLPDGTKKELTVNRFSLIKDTIHDICKEHKIDHPVVRIAATYAPISLDSNAALLENHEIIIEESRVEPKDVIQVEDPRLFNLKALVSSEEKYHESLKTAVEIYGESLRKSSLNHLDHKIIFGRLKPIEEITTKLLAKLNELVDNWDHNVFIASAFSNFPDILWVYDNYFSRLRESKRLLRQKCKYDSDFFAMVNEVKLTAKASLGLLILLPARRISEYKCYITEAVECTPDDHDDGPKLKAIQERFEQLLFERKEDIEEVENEFRLIEIQEKFPHDDLGLDEERGSSAGMQKYRQPFSRRRSAPTTAIKNAFGKTSKSSVHSIDISLTIHSDPASLSPENTSIFISEGIVQLTTGVSSHDRYMFLFNDFLFIAKSSKSSTNYKLKYRVKLSEMWLADCIDDVAESIKSPDKSFVLGWPTENFVASFSTVEEKNKWYQALSSNVGIQKELQEPKTIVIKIVYKESDTFQNLTKTLSVGHLDDANKVVQMALDHFNIPSKESNEFQLWVLFKDGAYPLIGHEFPFSIQMNQHREFSIIDDIDTTAEVVADCTQTTPSIQVEPVNNEGQLQFFLKRSRKLHNKVSSKRWIKKPIQWKMNKKGTGTKPSSYDMAISTGKVFGLPLDHLTSDDELVPKPINDLLLRLFRYGPSTSGVFRRTPNQRAVKDLKEIIDEEKDLSLEETSVHVVAGLVKAFLRRLPDSICCCDYYEEFLATNDVNDKTERIVEIKRLLDKLPSCNLDLIKRFLCVLYHISQNSEMNKMTSFNLAVCVAPSMLWPPLSEKAETAEQAKNTAPQFIEFIIDNFPEVFGEDAVSVLGDMSEIVVDAPVIYEDGESEVFDNSEEIQPEVDLTLRPSRSTSNLSKEGDNEDDSDLNGSSLTIEDKPIARSTPSSPVSCRRSVEKNSEMSRKLHAAFYHPKFSPRNTKRRLERSNAANDTLSTTPPDETTLPKKPVILATTTTSAELIEHIPNLNDEVEKKRSASFSGSASLGDEPGSESSDSKKNSVSKRDGLRFTTSQNFYTAPAHIAERVYCIDRRRQPAAPSYREHMQRHRVNQPGPRLQIPGSLPEDTTCEVPAGNKSHAMKVGLTLPSASAQVNSLGGDPHLSPSRVSPVSSEPSARSKRSTGSETSISSLSSNEEGIGDTEMTSTEEEKQDVTQLKRIQDLLEVSGYTNPLRISPETKDLISKTEGEWNHLGQEECSEMDDFQRMTMAEETYV